MGKIDVNDIVGKRFGKLTVLESLHKKKTKSGYAYYYKCQCDCGNISYPDRASLKRKHGTISCGCINVGNSLVGKKFGKLTVLKEDKRVPRYNANGTLKGHRIFYLCKCDCGNIVSVNRDGLLRGSTKSCGCYAKEKAKIANTKHNLTHHRLYNIFHHVRARCLKPNCKTYPQYGGRGIKICEEWKNDFMNFYSWAMSNGYKDNLTLDRIDVNGNYDPNNCRWADMKTQTNNKTNNFLITIFNRTQTLTEWCEEKGLSYEKISARISQGWSIEDAFTKE